MNIYPVRWKKWEALCCATDQWELIVGISAGPRILSFSQPGSSNLLYEDETGFGVGDWKLYGGHRFTIAPETTETYLPDNSACTWTRKNDSLLVEAERRTDGLQLSFEISVAMDGKSVQVLHHLKNRGDAPWQGALWAITCFPRNARLLARCEAAVLTYWPGGDETVWKRENGVLTVMDSLNRAKLGWHSEFPSLTAIQEAGTVQITHPHSSVAARCLDNGSNTELFVCADFMELETLSEKIIVEPGYSASHLQEWRLLTAASEAIYG